MIAGIILSLFCNQRLETCLVTKDLRPEQVSPHKDLRPGLAKKDSWTSLFYRNRRQLRRQNVKQMERMNPLPPVIAQNTKSQLLCFFWTDTCVCAHPAFWWDCQFALCQNKPRQKQTTSSSPVFIQMTVSRSRRCLLFTSRPNWDKMICHQECSFALWLEHRWWQVCRWQLQSTAELSFFSGSIIAIKNKKDPGAAKCGDISSCTSDRRESTVGCLLRAKKQP